MRNKRFKYIPFNSIVLLLLLFLFASANLNENNTDSINLAKEKQYIDNLVIEYNNRQLLQLDTILPLLVYINDLSEELNYKKGIAETNYLIGNFYDLRSIGDSSIKYYLKGWELGKELNYNHYINKFGEFIAETFWETGNYYEGLDFTKTIIDHYTNLKYTNRLFYLYDVLALIYRDLGDFNSALDYFNKSYEQSISVKQFGFAGTTLTNIGALYLQQKEYKTALEYYERGVVEEEKYGHIAYAGRSYVSIARIYLELEQPDRTEFYLNKALINNTKTNDMIGFSRTYKAFGELHSFKKQYKEAFNHLKKSEELAVKGGKNLVLAEIYKDISDTYEHLEKYDSSLIYLQKYLEIYQSKIDLKKLTDLKRFEYELKVEKNNSRVKQIELDKQETKYSLLIVIVALSIVAMILFISLYFQSIRSKRQLSKINKALEKASNKAEESDELKSQFLKNISHEIRTPLNGIVGFSAMITEEDLEEKELKDIQFYLQKNSDELLSTIDNIVDIAHLTSNQYIILKEHFYISDFIKDFNIFLKEKAIYQDAKHLTFDFIETSNIEVYTDKNIISKILFQFVSNAIAHTKNGMISIGVETIDSQIKFFVKDTGIGIEQQKIKIIFSAFRQGSENNLTRGNGLGLAIANHLAKLLNGEIGVESTLKKGSTFWLAIPNVNKADS
ncbi:MAG: tetratricopeptide repeat protein [Bacteroidales bacterium]|nr:tetratricopeptide repeat protein [Bacteroidales bacterium]